jgi:hypothetical protein
MSYREPRHLGNGGEFSAVSRAGERAAFML